MTKQHLKTFKQHFTFAVLFVVILGLAPVPASALEIRDVAVEIRNDFVLEPAKTEVLLKPGEKATKQLSIVNRTDREQAFDVSVEDFAGSQDPNQVVVLLGNDKGPYSLRDYIKPEVKSFKLKPRQRALMQVEINVPADAEPGGHYGSILVSTSPAGSQQNEFDENRAKTVSRIGALYFVRVAGPVKEEGRLTDFRLAGNASVRQGGPYDFELLFENLGNVHLTPFGRLEVKNTFGKKVAQLDVVPFFSLPESLRGTELAWSPGFAFGRYTATIYLDRNYISSPTEIDEQTLVFWVLPWKLILAFIVVVLVITFVLRFILRSFEIKRKKK